MVELSGRRHYLGVHGTPESWEAYHRLVAQWEAGGRRPLDRPADLTVVELVDRYSAFAEEYYGAGSSTLSEIRYARHPMVALYGRTAAADFGPAALKTVREAMIGKGWCRGTVNDRVGILKRIIRWAVAEELVPSSTLHALEAVDGLRRGRTRAPEPEPVRPVPDHLIDLVRPCVSRQVRAVIDLQLLTGARPSEILTMRPMDLTVGDRVWEYRPATHKTAWRGRERVIYLGPRAQDVVRPFLNRPMDRPLFSPAEAEAERRERKHAERKTPLHYGNRPGTNRARRPRREPGEAYTPDSYRRAIERGVAAACPEGLEGADRAAWIKEHSWSPYRLRHNAATRIRREHGLEAAALVLGHSSPILTDAVYAERNLEQVAGVVAKIG